MRAGLTMVACGVLVAASAYAGETPPALKLSGPKAESASFQVADLQSLPVVRELTVTEPHGKASVRYRGVPLIALLSMVGAPVGESLRGPALALHARIEAADGYRASFSLAELDAGVGGTDALLAFERDGQPIGPDVGPLRLVVPTDKRAARWVRQVLAIRLLD